MALREQFRVRLNEDSCEKLDLAGVADRRKADSHTLVGEMTALMLCSTSVLRSANASIFPKCNCVKCANVSIANLMPDALKFSSRHFRQHDGIIIMIIV